ncbi:MAG: DUF309 domain-containing protein [Chloroflexi bacterium]|nr:DUF309 domain-containing protein [Chloroflexota bacterium]
MTDVRADEPWPAELGQAIEDFNRGEYHACHDALETLWKRERRPIRQAYQGIIQLAVAFHHLTNGNRRGAELCLERAWGRLLPFEQGALGLDIRSLLAASQAAFENATGAAEGTGSRLGPTIRRSGAWEQPGQPVRPPS